MDNSRGCTHEECCSQTVNKPKQEKIQNNGLHCFVCVPSDWDVQHTKNESEHIHEISIGEIKAKSI